MIEKRKIDFLGKNLSRSGVSVLETREEGTSSPEKFSMVARKGVKWGGGRVNWGVDYWLAKGV